MRRTYLSMLVAGTAAAVLGGQALQAHATGPSSMSTGKIQEYSMPYPFQGYNETAPVTMGSDGNMWVLQIRTSSVTRVTPTGQATIFPVTPASGLETAIAAGPDGALYVGQYEGNIIRMTTSGVITNVFPALPYGWQGQIASGPDGNLWFTGGGGIGRMTPQGIVTMFPTPNGSSGLTAGPDGNIWYTDVVDGYTTAYIGRLDIKTGVATEYPVPQNVNGHTSPSDITAGPDGNVWFSDAFDQIGKVTPSGVITTYAVGQENPYPSIPAGIVTGPDGGLWFTIEAFGVLGRMATDGTWQRFPLPYVGSQPADIARGPHNTVWFTESRPTVGYIKTCGASAGCTMG